MSKQIKVSNEVYNQLTNNKGNLSYNDYIEQLGQRTSITNQLDNSEVLKNLNDIKEVLSRFLITLKRNDLEVEYQSIPKETNKSTNSIPVNQKNTFVKGIEYTQSPHNSIPKCNCSCQECLKDPLKEKHYNCRESVKCFLQNQAT